MKDILTHGFANGPLQIDPSQTYKLNSKQPVKADCDPKVHGSKKLRKNERPKAKREVPSNSYPPLPESIPHPRDQYNQNNPYPLSNNPYRQHNPNTSPPNNRNNVAPSPLNCPAGHGGRKGAYCCAGQQNNAGSVSDCVGMAFPPPGLPNPFRLSSRIFIVP